MNKKRADLLNILLDAKYVHNFNTHSVTKFRPVDLINNTKEEIFNEVIANNTKKYNKKIWNIQLLKKVLNLD